MKTLTNFYSEEERTISNFITAFSKPKTRKPMDFAQQMALRHYMKQVYNPKIKKLKEAQQFMEEWVEPSGKYART